MFARVRDGVCMCVFLCMFVCVLMCMCVCPYMSCVHVCVQVCAFFHEVFPQFSELEQGGWELKEHTAGGWVGGWAVGWVGVRKIKRNGS